MSNQIDYDELLKKYNELLEENGKLRAENQKLKKLLEGINNSSFSFIKNLSISESLSNQIEDEKTSIQIFPGNDSINIEEGLLPFSENDSHFICIKCHKVPVIEFSSLKTFNFSCTCFEIKNISLEDIIKNYVISGKMNENDNNNIESYFKCTIHNKKFVYYCKFDKEQLCRICIKQKYYHQLHPLYFFDFSFFEINQKKNQIFKILNEKPKEMNLEFNDANLLLNLFSVISNDFTLHPNYSHFIIIEKALRFLEEFISNKNNNKIIESLNFQKRLIIKYKKILYENMINANIIIEIDIKNSNINDITQICELDFINLEKLYLSENSISNVEPLLRAKFKKIRNLGFSRNKIGNENIPYFLEMKFEQLEELNLYSNNLTDSKIFNLQNNQNLPNLKIFYMGNNRIDWARKNSFDLKYNFKSLTVIGLTCGIFDKYTIKNINSFDFSKLKIIYLSKCDFDSLDFVKYLELPFIEEFYLNITFIKEFYPLIKYKNLKIIEMRENFIENIDELELFIQKLPKLKQFNILKNNINMNLEKNKKIMKDVKNIRINLDIIT